MEKSTIDTGHPLRASFDEACQRAVCILAKVEKTPKKDDKSAIKLDSINSGFKRAHLAVPGELKDWHSDLELQFMMPKTW